MTVFHVTPLNNIESIRKNGLIPQLGERSIEFGEEVPAVFCFKTMIAVEDAITNWFGECFDEEIPLMVLELELPDNIQTIKTSAEFEIAITEKIFPIDEKNLKNMKIF